MSVETCEEALDRDRTPECGHRPDHPQRLPAEAAGRGAPRAPAKPGSGSSPASRWPAACCRGSSTRTPPSPRTTTAPSTGTGEAFDVGETFSGWTTPPAWPWWRLSRWSRRGMTMAQFALRWIIDQPGVSVVIPGARNADRRAPTLPRPLLAPLSGGPSGRRVRRVYDELIRPQSTTAGSPDARRLCVPATTGLRGARARSGRGGPLPVRVTLTAPGTATVPGTTSARRIGSTEGLTAGTASRAATAGQVTGSPPVPGTAVPPEAAHTFAAHRGHEEVEHKQQRGKQRDQRHAPRPPGQGWNRGPRPRRAAPEAGASATASAPLPARQRTPSKHVRGPAAPPRLRCCHRVQVHVAASGREAATAHPHHRTRRGWRPAPGSLPSPAPSTTAAGTVQTAGSLRHPSSAPRRYGSPAAPRAA